MSFGREACARKNLGTSSRTDAMPWGVVASHSQPRPLQQPGPFTYAHLVMMTLLPLLWLAAQGVYS